VKFLLDAQLPRRLCLALSGRGHDAIHTLDLANGNRTSDAEITAIADRDGRIVVTKDHDFVTSQVLGRGPARLLLITTGNMKNVELVHLVLVNLDAITGMLAQTGLVELSRERLVTRD